MEKSTRRISKKASRFILPFIAEEILLSNLGKFDE